MIDAPRPSRTKLWAVRHSRCALHLQTSMPTMPIVQPQATEASAHVPNGTHTSKAPISCLPPCPLTALTAQSRKRCALSP